MAIEISTNLSPKNGQNYYILDSDYLKGGPFQKPNLAALNAIPMSLRKHGTGGFAQDTQIDYICDATLNWVPKEGNSGDRIAYKVTQTSHGFIKGDVIGYDSNQYVKVIANDTDDTDALGMVSLVIDPNNFEITLAGRINLSGIVTYADNVAEGSITSNTTYFLSPLQAGKLELNEPTTVGHIEKAILITLSDSVGIVRIGTGVEVTTEVEEDAVDDVGYYQIMKNGTSYPQRSIIDLIGVNWTIEDDAVNNKTKVTFSVNSIGLFSGDIQNNGPENLVTVIRNDVVNNNKLANMPALTIKGNNLNTIGDPIDLTVTQVKSLLGIATGSINKIAKFNSTSTLADSQITDDGLSVKITSLSGSGSRMVVAAADGTLSTQSIPTGGGSGTITSINGLTTAVQTFATPGTIGVAPNWVSSGSVHTLNIPLASSAGVTRGALSKVDYDVFAAKLGGNGTTNFIPKYTGVNILGNSNISDSGSAVIISVPDVAVFNSTVNYNLLRLVNGENNSEVYLATHGSVGNSNYWSGFATANTNLLYSNKTLVITSSNNLVFSGSGAAEHFKISSSGVISATNLVGSGTRMVVVNSTGVFSTQAIPAPSAGGITSLGGLTGSSQIFGAGTSGTTHAISSSGVQHTLNIPNAGTSGVTSGTINNTQFNTFNNKIGGSGTTNFLSKFTASGSIGSSTLSETSGVLTIPGLGGSGTRMVVVDNSGVLSQQAIPSFSGITGSGSFGQLAVFTDGQVIGSSAIQEQSNSISIAGDRALSIISKSFNSDPAFILGSGFYVAGNGNIFINGGAIPTTQSRAVDWWRVYRDVNGFLKV